MSDEVTTSLDQTLPISAESHKEIFDDVHEIIDGAMRSGPENALRYGAALRMEGHTRALSIAHLLYELKEKWSSFPTDDTFEDAVFKRMGYSQQTVDKYIAVWGRIFENPAIADPTKERLLGKPMNALMAVSAAAADNQMNEESWDNVVKAHDVASVKQIVREVRGLRTSANNATIYLVERDGYLKFRKGNSKYKEAGFFNIGSEDTDVQEAVETAIRRIGAMKR